VLHKIDLQFFPFLIKESIRKSLNVRNTHGKGTENIDGYQQVKWEEKKKKGGESDV
jgi:hypothetical protein